MLKEWTLHKSTNLMKYAFKYFFFYIEWQKNKWSESQEDSHANNL